MAMMPGAPPLNVVSMAERATVPFTEKARVDPTAVSVNVVPAVNVLTR